MHLAEAYGAPEGGGEPAIIFAATLPCAVRVQYCRNIDLILHGFSVLMTPRKDCWTIDLFSSSFLKGQ